MEWRVGVVWGGFSGSNRVRKPWCVGSESLGTGFELSGQTGCESPGVSGAKASAQGPSQPGAKASAKPPQASSPPACR